MEYESNPQLELAFDFVEFTDRSVFLTGKAGTGKTTFLHNLKKKSPKRMIVLAPTGVAAINAGGVTIHSFFQLPFSPYIPEYQTKIMESGFGGASSARDHLQKFNRTKINIIKSLDLLVIDEISMVRADLLDAVDEVLRRYRDKSKPFGGLQLLLIGDLHQLAPVAKEEDWNLLKEYYPTVFFFSSRSLQQTSYLTIELKHIYRQSDKRFIELLNNVRNNLITQEIIQTLNTRYIPGFSSKENKGYITLTTHNYQAQELNEIRLNDLPDKPVRFTARVEGEFPEYSYPTSFELLLKKNAQVMFVKNDLSGEKLYYNGKIGSITSIEDKIVYVKCPGDEGIITVTPVSWENNRYDLDKETKEIKETIAGTFTQYPLKLAWAITIHKSQGLTFEKAIIDANAAFAHGQVYVALSRCKTFEGMVLISPISSSAIKRDNSVQSFTHEMEQHPPGPQQLAESKSVYQRSLLTELFDFGTIEQRLQYCLKLVNENLSSLLKSFFESLQQLQADIQRDLSAVSWKFQPQLHQLMSSADDLEGNQALQDRLIKACIYFHEKTESVLNSYLKKIRIETDNKTVRKSVSEALEFLWQEVAVKLACFSACKSGFSVKNYQQARAMAAIEPREPVARLSLPDQSGFSESHPELFRILKNWRNATAKDLDLDHYRVLSQQTLLNLVESLPVSEYELIKVKGIGKKKARQFGKEILLLIRTYLAEHSIDKQPQEAEMPELKALLKPHTRELSYELYQLGKTVNEIASLRGLAASTIHGHLAYYVRTGALDVRQFVTPEILASVSEQAILMGAVPLGELKAAVGDEVTYQELRYVICYREFLASGAPESDQDSPSGQDPGYHSG